MFDYKESEIRELFNGYVFVSNQNQCEDGEKSDKTETEVFKSDADFVQDHEASSSNSISKDKNCLCSFCGKSFHAKHNLNVHMYQFHYNSSTVYACNFCTKTFNHSFLLTKHIRRTHESNYPCDICKKPFKTRFNLSRHISKLH